MKELLTLRTKNVHFTFDNQVYQQNDGVAEGFSITNNSCWYLHG